MVFDPSACQFVKEEQSEGEGILAPKGKSRRNVSDLSSQNSEVKAASLPLVRGPANQGWLLDDNDDCSIMLPTTQLDDVIIPSYKSPLTTYGSRAFVFTHCFDGEILPKRVEIRSHEGPGKC